MRKSDEADYRDLVVSRLDAWRHTAYLVCHDWHLADDLAAQVIEKLYRRWRKISEVRDIDAYVRGMLVRAWIDELRRPNRRELTVAQVRDVSIRDSGVAGPVVERLTLESRLAALPPRRRAILVLRYFCDLSVMDTAEVLGITEGTVKSQTARALESLRGELPSDTETADVGGSEQ